MASLMVLHRLLRRSRRSSDADLEAVVRFLRPTRKSLQVAYLVALILVLNGIGFAWNVRTDLNVQNQDQQTLQKALTTNNRAWCASLDLLTSAPRPGPKQVIGRHLYDNFVTLRHRFGCDQ